jgi:AcrR family transcriptional regulator
MSSTPGEMPSHSGELCEQLTERILNAAADEYITAGIKHATLADVAQRAAVSEQAIRQRWSDAQELVAAVVIRDLHTRLGAITGALRRLECIDDRIAESFAAVVWFLDGHPLVGGAVRADADLILPSAERSVSPIVTAGVAAITQFLAVLVRDDTGRAVDTGALHEVMTRLTQSLLLTRGVSTPLSSRNDVLEYAHRCVVPLVHAFIR